MLISEIRDEIIEEVGEDTSDTVIQGKIFNFIKAAMRRLPQHVISRTLLTTELLSLSASANSLTLPTTFIKERYVYRKNPDGAKIEITRLDEARFNLENNATPGSIAHYRIIGKTMEFNRTAIGADTIYCECFKSQVSGLAASDTFFGNDDEVETLKDLTKYRYYTDYQEDPVKAGVSKEDAGAGISKMNADYMQKELPSHVEES